MNIRGFLETSFLDWDGKISSVIFLPFCNFNCPFCNNRILVKTPEILPEVKLERIIKFIAERRDFIDGVVISGGEPTIHGWLPELITKLPCPVKLDTNGTNPAMLKELLDKKMLAYVAMDIKAPLDERYSVAAGVAVDLHKIRASVKLLMASGIDYEFRTTVIPTLHQEEETLEIAKKLAGAKRLVLQQFMPVDTLDEKYKKIIPYPKEVIISLTEKARPYIPQTVVRGL